MKQLGKPARRGKVVGLSKAIQYASLRSASLVGQERYHEQKTCKKQIGAEKSA